MNGELQKEVEGLEDLDFGFTPATNYFQLRRIKLKVGEKISFKIAWYDLHSKSLTPLLQTYRRISETMYAYESPQGPYKAVLIVGNSGFVVDYPGLWFSLRH